MLTNVVIMYRDNKYLQNPDNHRVLQYPQAGISLYVDSVAIVAIWRGSLKHVSKGLSYGINLT